MQAFKPSRAACAATEFARLPVDEQATVSNPKLRVGERDRDDAVFKAQGRQANRVILDVKIGRADALAEVWSA